MNHIHRKLYSGAYRPYPREAFKFKGLFEDTQRSSSWLSKNSRPHFSVVVICRTYTCYTKFFNLILWLRSETIHDFKVPGSTDFFNNSSFGKKVHSLIFLKNSLKIHLILLYLKTLFKYVIAKLTLFCHSLVSFSSLTSWGIIQESSEEITKKEPILHWKNLLA